MKMSDVFKTLGETHPLVGAVGEFEKSGTEIELLRNFTVCKTLLAYMKYRDEITKEEQQAVNRHINERVKLIQPGERKGGQCS